MEVDELDTGLLEQFGSLQTVDHADLIRQMRRLVGGEDVVSESAAQFYLEMSNWNVHSAVGHYFDLNGGSGITVLDSKLPSMTFIRDVTIGEGEAVPPATDFTKTWSVSNSGNEAWPSGCTLRFTQGHKFKTDACNDRVEVGCLEPGQEADMSIRMRSPEVAGIYEAQWRMATSSGNFFGDTIWVILTVENSGTLALTQQMDSFHDLGRTISPAALTGGNLSGGVHAPANSPSHGPHPVINPFASPPRGSIGGGSLQLPASSLLRPSSPTDREQTVVSARNILVRTVSGSNLQPPRNDAMNGGDDDEDMMN